MAKKSKISKELEDKLKAIYPESRGLDQDRRYDAETTKDPTDPKELGEWAKDPTQSDVKGFDDTSGREPTVKQVIDTVSSGRDGDSGERVVKDEPERFVIDSSEAGRLIAEKKDKIVDYQSFIKAVKEAWKDDGSLTSLLDSIGDKRRHLQEMFKQPIIQGYIDENTRPMMVNYIMKKFGVEPVRASNIVNKLPVRIRARLYHKAQRVRLPKIRLPVRRQATSRRPVGRQVTSRRRWSEQEINILKANSNSTPDVAIRLFKSITTYDRSDTSIRNMLYRIKRGEI